MAKHIFLNVLDFSEPDSLETDSQGRPWVDAFKAGDWVDPRYGTTKIDDAYLDSIIKNFNDGVRGVEIAVDYDHGTDPAKGNKAAGWIRAVRKVGDKVQTAIEFTEEAAKEIKDKQWRYFSPRFVDEYTHSDGGKVFGPTMLLGSLTNTPVFKGMAPINFSEAILDAEMTLTLEDKAVTAPPQPPSPPNNDKEDQMDEAKLRQMLGLDDKASIEDAVKNLQKDAKDFSELRDRAEKHKTFAEQFPEEFKRQQEMEERLVKSEAKEFAEYMLTPLVDGDKKSKVLPPKSVDKVKELYKNFSEGKGSVDDLKTILDEVRTAGLIELGERGSSSDKDGERGFSEGSDLVKQFSEKMGDIMRKDGTSPHEAMQTAAQEHPELYQAYINREIPVK